MIKTLFSLLSVSSVLSAGPADRTPDPRVCVAPSGPEYYAFDLVGTNRVAGTGAARGVAEVSVPTSSPFSVALTPDGSYRYDIQISLQRMRAPREGVLVAWVTDSNLDRVERFGRLNEHLMGGGSVAWNKFIVVITLEPDDDPTSPRWTGPVVFRGMSRSGKMHTMVGHGALQQENCAAYGYDD